MVFTPFDGFMPSNRTLKVIWSASFYMSFPELGALRGTLGECGEVGGTDKDGSLISITIGNCTFLVCFILQCDFSVEKVGKPLILHFEEEKPEAQAVSYIFKFIKYS